MSTKSELRLTDTNAASDSKGRTWGLEGGLFWWLIAGIGASIIVFFVLLVLLHESLTEKTSNRSYKWDVVEDIPGGVDIDTARI